MNGPNVNSLSSLWLPCMQLGENVLYKVKWGFAGKNGDKVIFYRQQWSALKCVGDTMDLQPWWYKGIFMCWCDKKDLKKKFDGEIFFLPFLSWYPCSDFSSLGKKLVRPPQRENQVFFFAFWFFPCSEICKNLGWTSLCSCRSYFME